MSFFWHVKSTIHGDPRSRAWTCRCVWARPTVLQVAHWLQWRFDNAKALLVLQLRRAWSYLEKLASHLATAIIQNVKAKLQRSDAGLDGSPASSCPMWVAAPGQRTMVRAKC